MDCGVGGRNVFNPNQKNTILGSIKSALLEYDYTQQIPVLGKQQPTQSFGLEVLTTNPFSTIQISKSAINSGRDLGPGHRMYLVPLELHTTGHPESDPKCHLNIQI